LVAWAADGVRGEVTIVVEGSSGAPAVATDPGSLRTAVAELEETGSTRKEAIAEVARRAGLPKREVYDVVHR
jgi:16S rRNA (cytidine1402-2'-O)-methyltransferase